MGEDRAELLMPGRSMFAMVPSGVKPSQWASEGGCSAWTMGDVVSHVIAATAMHAVLLDGAASDAAIQAVLSTGTNQLRAAADFSRYAETVE